MSLALAIPDTPAPYALDAVPEDDVPAVLRDRFGRLLAATYPTVADLYLARGWRTVRPRYRVLARCGDDVVGQITGMRLDADTTLTVYGLGDLIVEPAHRGRGLTRPLVGTAAARAFGQGADLVVASVRRLGPALRAVGFRPVAPFELYHEADRACISRPTWMLIARHRLPPGSLRLAEGHF